MGLDMYLEGSFSKRAYVRPTDQDYADMREGKEVTVEKSQALISYKGKYKPEYVDKKEFIQAKYMVISGSDNLTNNLEEELKIVTNG